MNRIRKSILGLVLAASAAAGLFAAVPPAVQKVTFSKTEGGPAVTSFKPSDRTFYAAVQLDRIQTGLKVRTVWIAVDTSAGQGIEIAEKEFTGLVVNLVKAQVELPRDWPTGKYKLDVFLNGTLAKSAEFAVR